MNLKNCIAAGIAAGVTNFLLGWVFYGILFKDIYPANENTNLTFIFLGCMTFGFFMSYIFIKWAGITNPMTGLTAGTIIGFLNGLSMNFFMYSNMPLNTQNFLIDVIITTITGAIMGAMIALVNRKLK